MPRTNHRPHAPPRSAANERLARNWFARDAETLAVDLLGCRLVRILSNGTSLVGSIVETEAYIGVHDRASHAFGGRRTPRNEAMYAVAGTAYVYFTYGMHFCFNVVCGGVDEPAAVLIRALEPHEGLETMREKRGPANHRDTDLCRGPARLCQAFDIDRRLNGIDLVTSRDLYLLLPDQTIPRENLAQSPRIGLNIPAEWGERPLRWYLRDNSCVSRPPFRKKVESSTDSSDPRESRKRTRI